MRARKLKWNTISSLTLQAVTFVCGFVLPRLIVKSYGSEVNGLLSSIMQFLNVITFMDLGVGAVVQSALYKPLADKDTIMISRIITSADRFFKKIAVILVGYIISLMIFYPCFVKQEFGYLSTTLLIAVLGATFFIQYYFGIVNRLILTADQLGYIHYNIQIITLILNTVFSVILIECGYSIHVVKLTTSCIYLFRPIVLHLYVRKFYTINRKIMYETEPILQKWNGAAQHVAAIVLDGTDTIILTLFAALSDVSVYSVYYMVVYGVKILFLSVTAGIQSLIGELWAIQDIKRLNKMFALFEWSIHTGVVVVFGCTAFLLVPFIQLYMGPIADANYIQPLFAGLLTLAHAGHCLRLPYNIMILAGGQYKQTQSSYIIAVIINLAASIAMVKVYGLVGVTIGTLAAMTYQTVWMAWYNSKNLLKWDFCNFVKQSLVDGLIVLTAGFVTYKVGIEVKNNLMWICAGARTVLIWGVTSFMINSIFYRDRIKMLVDKIKH